MKKLLFILASILVTLIIVYIVLNPLKGTTWYSYHFMNENRNDCFEFGTFCCGQDYDIDIYHTEDGKYDRQPQFYYFYNPINKKVILFQKSVFDLKYYTTELHLIDSNTFYIEVSKFDTDTIYYGDTTLGILYHHYLHTFKTNVFNYYKVRYYKNSIQYSMKRAKDVRTDPYSEREP